VAADPRPAVRPVPFVRAIPGTVAALGAEQPTEGQVPMTFGRRKALTAVAAFAAAAMSVAACSSSGGGGGSTNNNGGTTGVGTAANKNITIGILADITGPASSGNKTVVEGVKAGAAYASRNGYNIKYVIGDTATNPTNTLAAAQKLVTQQHVLAVIANSALTFAAANYFTAHKVPVIGAGEDGPEWLTAKNMFSVFGALHTTDVADTQGKFFKMMGGTTLAALGYSVSPISSEQAKAAAEGSKAVGLKLGYLNAQFPFGSTNVGPAALAIKKAGVDTFASYTDPNTSFALISALRQNGVNLKVAMLPTGYGGDLTQAGPGALNAAQNVYFLLGYEPVEMQTPATKQFVADLATGGTTGEPTYAMYNGYASVALLVRALKAAGASATSSSIITGLSNIHDFDALGLWGGHKLDINDRQNIVTGVDNCIWMTKLVGNKFQVVNGADPICGKKLPGVTVSPSS
jgi:ABC-type branched-subunit amino acid transport system substrate-binding protein